MSRFAALRSTWKRIVRPCLDSPPSDELSPPTALPLPESPGDDSAVHALDGGDGVGNFGAGDPPPLQRVDEARLLVPERDPLPPVLLLAAEHHSEFGEEGVAVRGTGAGASGGPSTGTSPIGRRSSRASVVTVRPFSGGHHSSSRCCSRTRRARRAAGLPRRRASTSVALRSAASASRCSGPKSSTVPGESLLPLATPFRKPEEDPSVTEWRRRESNPGPSEIYEGLYARVRPFSVSHGDCRPAGGPGAISRSVSSSVAASDASDQPAKWRLPG